MRLRKASLAGGASILALAVCCPAAVAQAPASDEPVEQVVVTGSRIVRDGYQAPTPVTVLSADELQTQAPANIADIVDKLPAVVGTATNQNTNQSFSAGQVGIVAVNLRNLGANRTLVLVDGMRQVPSAITDVVDINTIPQGLVSRVDVVTGGASAAYGSDALAGVVNFILDTNYTGLKGEISGGITTYGDDANWKMSLTGGIPFANGRGHFLLSGELDHNDGIFGIPRKWNDTGTHLIANPAYAAGNGQPQYMVVSHAGFDTALVGGIITAGPLKGTAFGPGGTPYMFNYGTLQSGNISVGGDWATSQANDGDSLDQESSRQMVFSRASFNITPDIQVYAELSWVQAFTDGWDVRAFDFGNLTVSASNPFLPASVASRAAALGLSTLTVGSFLGDIPPIEFKGVRDTARINTGLNGALTLFGTEYSWSTYFQYGTNAASENGYSYQKSHLTNALDAVISPTTGAIVCRSTLTNPGNGCVPFNIFGTGVNTPAAVAYVDGSGNDSFRHDSFNETVEAGSIQGEPFSDWAGPVSLALGIEHRREAVTGIADPDSAHTDWYSGNYLPTIGSYNVTEGFAETVVPLAKDLSFARSLDLNLALRATSYSTSGYVTTYKVGATWAPVDDIKLRFTRSRDIRAPNLSELYAAGTAGTNTVMNPFTHGTDTDVTITTGNTALKPEKADTTGVGVVLSPRWVPGLNVSVDYYNIHIRDAIGNINQQQIVNNCFAGQQQYCDVITFGPGQSISIVHTSPFNISSQIANGIDFEGSYTMETADIVAGWPGSLDFRALATHYIQNKINNPFSGAPYNTVGENDNLTSNTSFGPPRWVYQFGATYSDAPLTLNLTARGLSGGVYAYNNYRMIGCASGCPTSTSSAPTIANNHIPGAFYLDAAVSYDIGPAQLFLAVKNVFNTDPPILPSGTGVPNLAQTNVSLYDVLGRTFRAGVRFKF